MDRCISGSNVVLACHDWTELAMVSHLGLSYPVVFFMHGDYYYYYNTALKNEEAISIFVAPTVNLYNNLLKLLPHRKSDIIQTSYPVLTPNVKSLNFNQIACAYYVANLTDVNKNFKAIPLIDKLLVEQGLYINWNIAGDGLSETEFIEYWDNFDPNRIKFFGYVAPHELPDYIQSSNVFILPSIVEGLPISLIESMKSGLVPIVNAWNDSVFEYIENGVNGFIIKDGHLQDFSKSILLLNEDKQLFRKISNNAKSTTLDKNNLEVSASMIQELFFKVANKTINLNPKKLYGSRLDHPLMPNCLTKLIRKTLSSDLW
jgi:glycosyltransferase involved in cell wall biosynthesis